MILIWIAIFIISIIYSYFIVKWLTRKTVWKYISFVSVVCGVMGKGKTAFATGIANNCMKKGQRTFSNYPIFKKNNFMLEREMIFDFPNGKYLFEENDFLILDEYSYYVGSRDVNNNKQLFESMIKSSGMYVKLIRHLSNSKLMLIEQHPSKITKDTREKIGSFIQIVSRVNIPFFVKFKVRIYEMEEDYGKIPRTRKELKKGASRNCVGETKTLNIVFTKKSVYKKYDSRNYKIIHDILSSLDKNKNIKPKKFNHHEMTVDDIRKVSFDRLDKILDKYEKQKELDKQRKTEYAKYENKQDQNSTKTKNRSFITLKKITNKIKALFNSKKKKTK